MSDSSLNLVLQNEQHPDSRVAISCNPFIVGGGAECDLQIQHAGISNPHACIVKRNNEYTVWDLTSCNGTYIIRSGSGMAEPGVDAVPKINSVDELSSVDWERAIRLHSGMRIAFASDRWMVNADASKVRSCNIANPERDGLLTVDSPGVHNECGVHGIGLEILEGSDAGRLISVSDFPAVLGRSASKSSIVFNSEKRKISGAHAVLVRDERDRVCIEDCESLNGTFLNHKPVKERKVLRNGDNINLGRELLIRVHIQKRTSAIRWMINVGLVVVVLAMMVPIVMIGEAKLTEWLKHRDVPAPPPVAYKTLADWGEYLKAYEELLPGIGKTFGDVSERCVRDRWSPLTNSIASLALILSEDIENVPASFDAWKQDVERDLSSDEDIVSSFTSYGDQRVKAHINRGETHLLNMFVEAVANGELRKAKETMIRISNLGSQNKFMNIASQVIERLEIMPDPSCDLDMWLNNRQDLIVMDLPNDLREAVSKNIGMSENEVIQRLRTNAELDSAPESRMVFLRQAQRIQENHPGISADIVALRPLLEPLIRDRLIKAADLPSDRAQSIYRELIKLTQKGDWTEPYHERCLAFISINPE